MKSAHRDLPAQLALLCALALVGSACQRPSSQSAEPPVQATESRVAQATPPVAPVQPLVQPSPPPVITERQDVEQPPRAVEPPARSAPPVRSEPSQPKPDREQRLESRERRLAERQAALDAREKRLRQQEAQQPAPAAPATDEPPPYEPAAESAPVPAPTPEPAPEPERAEPVTVEAGTKLDVKLNRTLSSETSATGEIFRARIDQDIYAGDRVAIPAGSEVVGEVTQAVPGKKIGGKAVLNLRLTDLVLPSGETVPLKASFQQAGPSKSGRDAATIGGSTAGGAILGRILSNGSGKGTVIGAIVGAVAGSVIAARHPGEPVVIPEGSVLGIVIDRPLAIEGRR
jgi:type IV secretory pathway VirB10-like protein